MGWQRKRLTEEEKSNDSKKAKERAVWYLSQRGHAAQELNEKLCRFFTPQASAAAVAEMISLGYQNDGSYAAQKANSLLLSHKSRREIARVLAQKGVEASLIAETLEKIYEPECDAFFDVCENPELEAAKILIERRYQRKLNEGRKDLVVAALARRGFPYPIIRDAIAVAQDVE